MRAPIARLHSIMQATFSLQTEETGFFFLHASCQRLAGMDIAHRNVAPFPQRVVRKVLWHLQVAVDVPGSSADDRMYLVSSREVTINARPTASR